MRQPPPGAWRGRAWRSRRGVVARGARDSSEGTIGVMLLLAPEPPIKLGVPEEWGFKEWGLEIKKNTPKSHPEPLTPPKDPQNPPEPPKPLKTAPNLKKII